jgi:hypothetical protein
LKLEIVPIPAQRKAEAAAVLCDAFVEDDLFSNFFPTVDHHYQKRVATLFSWACDLHASFGMPFIAALQDDQVVGVAAVQEPSRYGATTLAVRLSRRIREAYVTLKVGLRASHLMKEYSAAVAPLRPPPPFHYVSYIGVLPAARATGMRARLLDAAFQLSCADPASRGLVLDTFSPAFARSLQASGWSLSGPVSCERISGFSLFRERAA